MSNRRLYIVLALVFIFITLLVVRLFNVQILQAEELKFKADRQQTKVEIIKAERGTILDRNNVALALNINTVSISIDLRMLPQNEKDKTAQVFSQVFGKPKQVYLSLFSEKGKTICVEKKVLSAKAEMIKNAKIKGLLISEDPTRSYPYSSLASHVIGYVNADFLGTNGIERAYNDELKGIDGKRLVERNALGEMITVAEDQTVKSVQGANLVLTIDNNYQKILEEELKNGLSTYGGISATGIIMDPNTGEILALANENDYDPNFYSKYSDTLRRNIAVTDMYEPGSTFKSFSMAALLDRKLCEESERIFVENGKYKYKNVNINDSHNKDYLTVRGIIEQSSNIGIAKLIQRLDDDTFYKYIRAFGFGNFTSIKLPGEVKGNVKNPNDWHNVTKAFMSFGYEILVTPIQLAAAYCAIVNGGILYQPQILKRVILPNGMITEELTPKKVRTVISAETSAKMRSFLTGVVSNGTATAAKLDGIIAGGKTGTSQKLINGSYSKSHYNSSFVGFFPVNNPKVVCLILVNSPTSGGYGGLVAAPIFKKVGDRIVSSDPVSFNKQGGSKDGEVKVIYANNNQKMNDVSLGNNSKQITESIKKKIMPDLYGFSLKEAVNILAKNGIKYKVKGSGKIASQSIKAGSQLKKNVECTIVCSENVTGKNKN
ncbi:MAG: penicillin-binding transpeptidase domain-containing protein [Bacteroidota bacterium]|nr:penicillin-binding transpeptidase domain-containing protein [Bacteroidota bacterium]